jgi:hypothetical protein
MQTPRVLRLTILGIAVALIFAGCGFTPNADEEQFVGEWTDEAGATWNFKNDGSIVIAGEDSLNLSWKVEDERLVVNSYRFILVFEASYTFDTTVTPQTVTLTVEDVGSAAEQAGLSFTGGESITLTEEAAQ